MTKKDVREILVYINTELENNQFMGYLRSSLVRGQEIFSFEYDKNWLKQPLGQVLDPDLQFYTGPQYPSSEKVNFGIFMDSAPDRWGRLLMKRKESIGKRGV